MIYLAVFLGGGAGSVLRYLVGRALANSGAALPAGTLAVNLLGCIIVGLLVRFGTGSPPESLQRAALVIGFCGGFTTFSAFSLETATMITEGRWGLASAYVATSVVGCVVGTITALGWTRHG